MPLKRLSRYKFKVIKKKSRGSAIVNGNSVFALKYLPGTDVWAKPNTLGIMVFKNITSAENFAASWNRQYYWDDSSYRFIVIRVLPYGKGSIPQTICSEIDSRSLHSYYGRYGHEWYGHGLPPDNTICYKGVHVID